MSVMLTVLLIVQVVSALTIIVLVLLQQGKGADMGSAFGGGSAGSLFGAAGAANFLSRTTKWAAVVFFVSTAALAYLGRPAPAASQGGVMENHPSDLSVPAVPGSAPAPAPAAPDASVPSVPATPPAAPAQPEAPAQKN
ncbi:MAG: preprotein translocase subunit SecG [Bordetella sp. SCN 67-23]|nr:preprotein translocase subunit SecG [Burkholderiales bacterium]ODS74559.1 MAG: preprotein translocase subunit SecG [Bordetella sp. SCN 67-23]ODU92572.1 MAG: preprotein translocase subunit SecG [Bordetella sp. SCN 68-11]OJW90587.1 MAG: preprotein translocase subunit SecG [Burkholderiales bacterium 67-32]